MSTFSNPARRAPEAASAYVRAVLELLGDREPLTVLEELVPALAAATCDLSRDELRRPEREGKWSIIQVVQHLADTELVIGYRVRVVLSQDAPTLPGFDQDAWAAALRYEHASLTSAMQQLRVLRESNLWLLQPLTAEQLERHGMHAERGKETLDRIIRLTAGHDLVHRRQLERIKSAIRPSPA